MALELAPYRIRVNAIAPGLTDTAQPRYGSSEDEIAAMTQTIPLGRIAQPDDVARTSVFLASDEAGFTTGQILHVNGGSYLGYGRRRCSEPFSPACSAAALPGLPKK